MHRTVSLRTFLTAPFLLVFLAAAGAISGISHRNALSAVEGYSRQFAAEIGARIHSHLQHFFGVPVMVVQFNREAMASGQLDVHRREALVRSFVSEMRHLPHLTFISFGGNDGEYVGATRDPESNAVQLMTAFAAEGMTMDTYAVTADHRRGALLQKGNAYDARLRPWFQLALDSDDRPFWYPVYRHRVYRSLGMGIAATVRGTRGELLGVLTGDLALSQLSRYLQGLDIGREGLAFLVDGEGRLLASSTAGSVFEIDGPAFRQISAAEHPDPLLRAAGRQLDAAAGAPRRFRHQGEYYLLDVRRLRDAYGLDLRTVVVMPERVFAASVEANARWALGLALAAVLCGAGIGVILTRWVAAPIERISARADRLAQGEFASDTRLASPVVEVNRLADNFEHMAARLGELIDHLEARVAERTQALQQARDELEQLSMHDGLTQIYNRRRFDQVLDDEWQRAQREQRPLALVLCDVDEFKLFNDHFGHHEGDRVLVAVAARVAAAARRPGDLGARYGGEEFALVLPDTELAGAIEVAEQLRLAVRAAALYRNDLARTDRVSLSLGVASQVPGPHDRAAALIEAADRQLYRAKEAGRDRVMPPGPPAGEPAPG